MAHQLKMDEIASIRTLYERGWTLRRIARELQLDRGTVRGHVRRWKGEEGSKPAKVIPGSVGQRSGCWTHEEWIGQQLELGLTARRIWQDLVAEKEFMGSYQSVKRYVRGIKSRQPQRIWRMECQPGEEVQVDFGTGYWLVDEAGRKRQAHVLRMVLSFSRKGYTEAVLRQDTETFLRGLENGFRAFGGVPATVILDNLKAAVLGADWYDPELNPKLTEFARHYGTVIVPTRPAKPQHKGKIEAGVKYVQDNALSGRSFPECRSMNEHLRHWETTVADLRIHGTTRQQVRQRFEMEKLHLKPLPLSLFPCYQEGQRQVHRDSYVEVERAYYQVPCEYIGRAVWVRWDSRMVRVFNQRFEGIASHAKADPGRFSHVLGAQGGPCPSLEESQRYWTERAARFGAHAQAWAEALFERRGPLALRVVQGLVGLSRLHSSIQIDGACQKALICGEYRLQQLRAWLLQPQVHPASFSFLETHPLIRDMGAYALTPDLFTTPQPPVACNG